MAGCKTPPGIDRPRALVGEARRLLADNLVKRTPTMLESMIGRAPSRAERLSTGRAAIPATLAGLRVVESVANNWGRIGTRGTGSPWCLHVKYPSTTRPSGDLS
jgi:hypothetical protein